MQTRPFLGWPVLLLLQALNVPTFLSGGKKIPFGSKPFLNSVTVGKGSTPGGALGLGLLREAPGTGQGRLAGAGAAKFRGCTAASSEQSSARANDRARKLQKVRSSGPRKG